MNLKQAILATIAYHDIFNYPLKLGEINRYLIGKKTTIISYEKELRQLKATQKIGDKENYYFLNSRSQIVALRRRREKYSNLKFKRAKIFLFLLKFIPTLKFAGISGALAMQNSSKDDDIDLVLISSKDFLWTTRFLANILLFPFKRDPQGTKVANRACLNLFLEEGSLKIKNQNLYTAHEICQMKPLWDRDNTYQKFIKANSWVRKYLPNWQPDRITNAKSQMPIHKSNKFITYHLGCMAERILRSFQFWYMRKKITTEKLGKGQLFFHPQNTEKWVIRKYKKKLRRFRIKL